MATLAIRQQKAATLANRAEQCIAAFQQCLYKAASVHSRELSLVEDQLARFSVWAGNMRVFGSLRHSLDHRLREAQDVRDTFDALLDAIKYRIENCTSSLETLGPEQSHGPSTDVNQVFQEAVHGIADQISLLHKLSNTIRRASKGIQNAEAAKAPRIRDGEGNDAEDFLQQIFAHYIRDRFPATSTTIQQRLASTMVLRRKRMLYRRSRYENNPILAQSRPAAPPVTVPRAQPTAQPRQEDPRQETEDPLQETEDCQSEKPSVRKSLAQSATTLAAEKFHKASTPSLVSVSKTVPLNSHEQLAFPPAPTEAIKMKLTQLKEQRKAGLVDMKHRLNGSDRSTAVEGRTPSQDWEDAVDAVGEIVCPFCFHALPAWEVVEETKWKQHVIGDLDAYVCLFEECTSSEELYSHSSQWLKHMRGHTLRWRCASKTHGDLTFTSREEYIEHMKTFHRSRLTDAQLRLLADKSSRSLGQMFESCPLCGLEGVLVNMEEHIIGHLRLLSIKSLPPYDAGGSEGLENASVTTSAKRSRSTIRDFMDAQSDFTVGSYRSEEHVGPEEDHQGYKSAMQRVDPSGSRPWSSGSVLRLGSGSSSDSLSGPDQFHSSSAQDSASGQPQKVVKLDPVKLDPNCAICWRPASPLTCNCEAEALEIAIRQAEAKVMRPHYDKVQNWVRKHTEHHVKTKFREAASQIEGGSDKVLDDSAAEFDEASKDVREPADAALKREINQMWCEAAQTYPSSLEYFYSLVTLTLPPDNDPAVRDPPPLADPPYKQWFFSDDIPDPPEVLNSSLELPKVANSSVPFYSEELLERLKTSGQPLAHAPPFDPNFMQYSEKFKARANASLRRLWQVKSHDIEPQPVVERAPTLNTERRTPPSPEPPPQPPEVGGDPVEKHER